MKRAELFPPQSVSKHLLPQITLFAKPRHSLVCPQIVPPCSRREPRAERLFHPTRAAAAISREAGSPGAPLESVAGGTPWRPVCNTGAPRDAGRGRRVAAGGALAPLCARPRPPLLRSGLLGAPHSLGCAAFLAALCSFHSKSRAPVWFTDRS